MLTFGLHNRSRAFGADADMQRASVTYLVVGLLTAGIGLAIMLAAAGIFGQPVQSPQNVHSDPSWLGALCGFIFFAGGASVIIRAFYGPADPQQSELPADAPAVVRFLYGALGVAIVVSLGATFTWIAVGPGERHFSGSGAFLGPGVGRAMFGLGALLAWSFLAIQGVRWARRRRAQ